MAWFLSRKKEEVDRMLKANDTADNNSIPDMPIDVPLILAEKQARKLLGRFIRLDSESKDLLTYFEKFIKENRLQEQFIRAEEQVSLRGQVILTLDR